MIDSKPPQAIEIEQNILGAMLIEDECIETAIDILKEGQSFYMPENLIIYATIRRMKLRGDGVDLSTVAIEMSRTSELEKVGGAYYISQLTNRVAGTANLEFWCRIIIQKYVQRLIINGSNRLTALAKEEGADIFDLMQQMSMVMDEADHVIGGTEKITPMSELAGTIMPRYLERKAAYERKEISGCPTGFMDLDEATGGWQDEDMIILAARPSMGKTAMLIHFSKIAAKSGRYAPLIFSVEMRKELLADRLFQGEAQDINPVSFRHGRMNAMEEEFAKGTIEGLQKLDIYIDDTSGIKPSQIFSRTKRLQRMTGKKVIVFVDYLGLMESDELHKNREDEISTISRKLKGIAKRTKCSMMVLAQMNRQVESRGGAKRPQLSDLRDSGAIEQDADVVLFLHRPEYYGITEGPGGESLKGVGEIIIAKQRNGPVTAYPGEYAFHYNKTLTSITDPKAGTGQGPAIHTLEPNRTFTQSDDLPF